LEIQRLTPEEGERLRAMRLRSLRDAPDAFSSTYDDNAARPPETWSAQLGDLPTFIAVIDGVDVGIARGDRDHICGTWAWLVSMWVDPGARGRGVGEALIDVVVEWARDQGMTQLLLDVADDNGPAIALYARKGFEPTGQTGTLPPPREHIHEHQRSLRLLNEE
jgi:GNAT superfamily N-acetyltransferase